jgi:hypothetical protein
MIETWGRDTQDSAPKCEFARPHLQSQQSSSRLRLLFVVSADFAPGD